MDRLSALIIIAALGACESKQQGTPAGRADTTKVVQKKVSTEAFCDVHFPGTTGPLFTVPPLVYPEGRSESGPLHSGGTLAAKVPTWRWINVWATWCKPCVNELPRLARWREQLGGKYELAFISVDENEEDLDAFRKAHPEAPASPRLADPDKQGDWYVSLGLDAGAPVPIHIFVEPGGHVRCARAGGVREQDYAAIQKLLSE